MTQDENTPVQAMEVRVGYSAHSNIRRNINHSNNSPKVVIATGGNSGLLQNTLIQERLFELSDEKQLRNMVSAGDLINKETETALLLPNEL